MSQYVDEAFQKITDKPCADCKFYLPHDTGNSLLAKCQHSFALSPVIRIMQYAHVMRDNDQLCGLEAILWQQQ